MSSANRQVQLREVASEVYEDEGCSLHHTVQIQTDEPNDTGVIQTQTPDDWQGKVQDMSVLASQTDDRPISDEIKKKVLLELGMNEELADACIEFPEELCLKLQDFTETHMPSSSYERVGVAQMESDSDNHSEVSTASTGRRARDEFSFLFPQNDEQKEELADIDEIHEDAPGGSQEPVDAVARPIGSVNPRFAQDRVVDVYWQHVLEQYQKGDLIVTQEDLEYFSEAHPIAKALAERDSHSFGPQTQAVIAASQGASSWMDPLPEIITPR